jgi:hypothetical protein
MTTITTRYTRGDWWPATRIEGVRRYAFIGDSTMYGAGVAPDETLPFFAERFLNEAQPGWPVEAINHGVSGYNIWNSWLGFKASPQVYDGVVLALCDNDAEMFSWTFELHLPDERYTTWEPSHPFGQALAACFDDIAAFCRQAALPAAVIVCNPYASTEDRRTAQIIGELCAARGLLCFDTFRLFTEHKYAPEAVRVSRVDGHPSALAHKTTARHLVKEMARLGWFRGFDGRQIGPAPERILAATHNMMDDEDYPPDAAHGWALRTLQVKTLVAGRLAATGNDDGFAEAAAHTRAQLESACLRWHAAQRAQACLQAGAAVQNGLGRTLQTLQMARLRLEELGFALDTPDAVPALALLCRCLAPASVDFDASMAQAPAMFAHFHNEFRRIQAGLDALQERVGMLASLQRLSQHTTAFTREAAALDAALAHTVTLYRARRTTVPDTQQRHIAALLADDLGNIKTQMGEALKQIARAESIAEPRIGTFTTIEATLTTPDRGDGKTAKPWMTPWMSLYAEYTVPHRLGFLTSCPFDADEQPVALRFHVPLLYAGRLTLRLRPPPGTKMAENFELLSIELVNNPGPRQAIAVSSFHKNEQDHLVSPPIFMV